MYATLLIVSSIGLGLVRAEPPPTVRAESPSKESNEDPPSAPPQASAPEGAGAEIRSEEAEPENKGANVDPANSEPPSDSPASPGETRAGETESVEKREEPALLHASEVGPEDNEDSEAVDLEDIFGSADDIDMEEVDAEEREEAGGSEASKKAELDFHLRIVTSAYFDIDDQRDGKRWQPESEGRGRISRNENRLEFYLSYTPNRHIQLVGDIEPVFMGVSQGSTLDDMASRQMLVPFHVESDAAYVAIIDALPGLDFKLGRQVVVWGSADKFNPTNNINPDDLEDRPLFTEPIANQMVVVDYAPWGDRLWAQAVYVPLFYPALLPPSAAAGLTDPDAPVPYVDEEDQNAITYLQGYIDRNPNFEPVVTSRVKSPQAHLRNGQAAVKLGSRLGEVDLSASYYYGFHDIPVPVYAQSTQVTPLNDPSVKPTTGHYYRSDVTMTYPRMHVAGADFSTQLSFLGDMGLWGEAGLFIPDRRYDFTVELPVPIDVTDGEFDDGTANPITTIDGPVIEKRPFIKATAGVDYTFGKHLYFQAQYLRGFIDDFGAGNIGNYLVAGSELVFFGRSLVVRLFGVADFARGEGDTSSAALAPSVLMTPPWGFATFELGGFALLGGSKTKFGQSAAGSSIAYLKLVGAF